jgi:hypothetical protein
LLTFTSRDCTFTQGYSTWTTDLGICLHDVQFGSLAPVLRGSLAASRFYKIGLKVDKYPKTSDMLYGTILEKTTESHFSQVFKYSNNNQAKGSTGFLKGKKKPIQKLKGGYRWMKSVKCLGIE